MGNTNSAPPATGIWQPPVNASWNYLLQGVLDPTKDLTPNVDVWDIDMFNTPSTTIDWLHGKGKHVVCYFSAGSYEPGRPDSDQFDDTLWGNELDGWPGERWLRTDNQRVRDIMSARIKIASDLHCDAIEPDNVDGYANTNTSLPLTKEGAVDFIKFLSSTAASYNMATGLKNAAGIIPDVLDITQFNVNEQCTQYGECASFNAYIGANKPVFHVEYPKGPEKNNDNALTLDQVNAACTETGKGDGSRGFSNVLKNINLNGWTQYCDGSTTITATTPGGKSRGDE